jgi:nitric oxide reductase activation protein
MDTIAAEEILNATALSARDTNGGADPKRIGSLIASPVKLKRHLTLAVKSPERVGVDRRQTSGRLDTQNIVGMGAGSTLVFKRRVEEEGREAAVVLLLDISGSMKGSRLNAAKAMALHMGDALKAAGVKFEISAFDDRVLLTPKAFNQPWNSDTRRQVSGLTTLNGTAMLPAIKQSAERILKIPNVSRRIILALTDGADGYSEQANQTHCRYLRGKGVEVVGIVLETYSDMKKPFDGRVVTVARARDLSEQGLKLLVQTLERDRV